MDYAKLIVAFLLLFLFRIDAVLNLFELGGLVFLVLAMWDLKDNKFNKYAMYTAGAWLLVWLFGLVLAYLIYPGLGESQLGTVSMLYSTIIYLVGATTIVLALLGIRDEAAVYGYEWIEVLCFITIGLFVVLTGISTFFTIENNVVVIILVVLMYLTRALLVSLPVMAKLNLD